jgi:nitroimidazol reductase NimA-like FMN-containing flavoprotein (pyridoxamine 5'-phosphate oxidase superfamily)
MSFKELKKMMDAVAMTKQEIENFLSFPRLARIATISNGKPHIAPVWYFYDGTNIVIPATKETKKIKNIKNNPNVRW